MNHKTKSVLIGVAAGALLGATLAWIASDGHKDEDGDGHSFSLKPTDYIALGISILTLARQFGSMVRKA